MTANTVIFTGSKTITKANIGLNNWFWPFDTARINPDLSTFSIAKAAPISVAYQACCWKYCEISKGVFDWTMTDKWVNAWKTLGKKMGAELGWTPDWANASMTAGLGNKAPTNMKDFADWVRAVGTRYNGQILYWTIRNEPRFSQAGAYYFIDTAAKYAEMTRVASQILKSINPNNKVMGIEMAVLSQVNTEFINFANADASGYDAGYGTGAGTTGKNWIDIVSVHPYTMPVDGAIANEANNIADWATFKTVMSTLGIGSLPIWASEFMFTGSDFNGNISRMLRNCTLSLLNSDMFIHYGWGASSAQWNGNDLIGLKSRIIWNSFCLTAFSSAWTQAVLNGTTGNIEVTQSNGNVFIV